MTIIGAYVAADTGIANVQFQAYQHCQQLSTSAPVPRIVTSIRAELSAFAEAGALVSAET